MYNVSSTLIFCLSLADYSAYISRVINIPCVYKHQAKKMKKKVERTRARTSFGLALEQSGCSKMELTLGP